LIGNTVWSGLDAAQLPSIINYGWCLHPLMNELYSPYGVKFIGGSTTGVEALVSQSGHYNM